MNMHEYANEEPRPRLRATREELRKPGKRLVIPNSTLNVFTYRSLS